MLPKPEVSINGLRDLIGIPFVQNGRDPRLGLDCWGLCR